MIIYSIDARKEPKKLNMILKNQNKRTIKKKTRKLRRRKIKNKMKMRRRKKTIMKLKVSKQCKN